MFGFGQGFTLIELLVVITVIGILATLVAPSIFQHVGAAKDATARSQIEMLGAALDAYRLDNGRYPTTQQGLDALWNSPTAQPRAAN
jgi:general secretion pathway protein G